MNPEEQIFVLKDGQRLGPFTPDGLLDQIERGAINYEDPCLRAGASECERVREILDWDEDDTATTADDSAEPRTEFPAKSAEAPEPEDEIEPEVIFDPDPDFDPVPDDEIEADDEGDFDLEEEIREALEESGGPLGPPANPNAVLYAGHPSFLSFPRTVLLVVVALGIGLWFRDSVPWIFLGGLIIALFAVSWIFLQRSMRLFLITPRRAEIVTGLFAKSSNEVRIEDIRTINVVKTGLVGLIGVGTVEFASSGGSTVEVSFQDVWAANRIKGLVRRLQDAADA